EAIPSSSREQGPARWSVTMPKPATSFAAQLPLTAFKSAVRGNSRLRAIQHPTPLSFVHLNFAAANMQPAVRIENLSKLYRIGTRQHVHYRTLRETLMDAAAAPWRRIKEIRSHSCIGANELNGHAQHGHAYYGQDPNSSAGNHPNLTDQAQQGTD